MSAGNGTAIRTAQLTRSTAEMSPHERSEQADTMRRKLVELAAAHNRLVEVVDAQSAALAALESLTRETWNRLDGVSARESRLTNRATIMDSSFMARLRWLFRGV